MENLRIIKRGKRIRRVKTCFISLISTVFFFLSNRSNPNKKKRISFGVFITEKIDFGGIFSDDQKEKNNNSALFLQKREKINKGLFQTICVTEKNIFEIEIISKINVNCDINYIIYYI